jgi:sporulation protein YlmC with PRC-barrel domain
MNTHVQKASMLKGMNVKNRNNENIGEIQDLMIDMDTGEISYAVLSFGGFMGIGDKYFAVPVEAMEISPDSNEVTMDISKEQLENAPGFNKDNWPMEASPEFVETVYEHYGYNRPQHTAGGRRSGHHGPNM